MNHPLTRPSGTLSPAEGERVGVRGRFRESEHLQKLDVSWGHEATPNPSGGGESMSGTLAEFPSWEGPGVGRFMESPLSFFRMHWDHEPWRSGVSAERRTSGNNSRRGSAETPLRGDGSWRVSFRFLRTHWHHEPPPHPTSGHPLPHWGEGKGEGAVHGGGPKSPTGARPAKIMLASARPRL